MKRIITGLIYLTAVISAAAVQPKLVVPRGAERDSIISRMYGELSRAKTNDDSITILYNIFDLSPRNNQYEVMMELYEVAKSQKKYTIMLDALRQAANRAVKNDSILRVLTNKARRIPDSNDQRETLAFLNIMQARNKSAQASSEERIGFIKDLVGYYNNHGTGDMYQRIQQLSEIAIYLNRTTGSYAVYEYLDYALALTDSITSLSNSLRNSVLASQAAMSLRSFDTEKVVKSNKQYIALLDTLESRYHAEGRIYKQYHSARYTALARILSKYGSLPIETVDSIYGELKMLASIDPDAAYEDENDPSARIFYLMAHKKYGEALPLLEKILDDPNLANTPYMRLLYLHSMIEASRGVKDNELLMRALDNYVTEANTLMYEMRQDRYRKLESLYDISHVRDQNQQLQMRYESEKKSQHKSQTRAFIILSVLLLILAGSLGVLFVRGRKLSNRLKETNEHLQTETEQLLKSQEELVKARDSAQQASRHKTEFVTNLSHEVTTPLDAIQEYSQLIVDCVDEKRRPYLQRFAEIIRLNTDLVKTIVSDVLEMGELEDSKIRPRLRPASLKSIIETAVGATSGKIQPGVELIQPSADKEDIIVVTDRHRVEQVLINLLSNAAKFTTEGSITFDYEVNQENEEVTFTVTDTGIGVPDGKEKQIFERFEKIDTSSQGSGLGLSICMAAARLLKGNIYCAEGMNRGSKFVFTIPIL